MRIAAVLVIGLAVAASHARADDLAKPAGENFARAEAKFAAGDRAGACPLYEQALVNGDHLLPWKNAFLATTKLALCKRDAGKVVSAAGLYRRAARLIRTNSTDAVNARKAAQADKVADDLDKLAPHLTVTVAAAARVDGLAIDIDGRALAASEWGRRAAIDGGTYRVRATAPGRAPFERAITVGREKDDQTVEIPPLARSTVATPTPPVKPVDRDHRFDAVATTEVRTRSRVPALVAAGAGVVALAIAGGFELSARSTYRDYKDDPLHPPELRDDANSKRDIANVMAIAGGVGVAAGVALWFLWPERVEKQPLPTVSAHTVGIQLTF